MRGQQGARLHVEELEAQYGYKMEDETNLTTHLSEDGKQYGLTYNKFTPMLVKAVQELSAKVEALSTSQNQVNDVAQIDDGMNAEERKVLEDEVESLRCREAELTNQIDELTKEVEGATAHWRDEMSAAVKHVSKFVRAYYSQGAVLVLADSTIII